MSFGQLQLCLGMALLESNVVAQTLCLSIRWIQVEQVFYEFARSVNNINAAWRTVRNESYGAVSR